MSAQQIHLIQGSPEWHAWRKTGLGASDTAALFGVSPYKTERDLWFEKAGLGQPDEDDDKAYIYQKGHETEDEIRDLFSKHTSIELKPTCFQNGIFLASLDGHKRNVGVLEAKLVGRDVLAKIAQGEIPEHHRIQVQAQLHTSESDKAYYGARAPKIKTGQVVEIGRDEKMIREIVDRGERFWESVQKGSVPPLSNKDTLFITDPSQVELFLKLKALKAKRDQLEAEYSEVEQLVKSLAVHPKVRCEDVTITDTERSGGIDFLKIPEVKALGEEYLEKFRKRPSYFKTLRFKKDA